MASIGWEDNRARILFRDEAGKQQSIRLGECPESDAIAARMAVGHLVIAKRHGSVPHPDAVRWLGRIDDILYARVVAHGLCQPRKSAEIVTLDRLLAGFFAGVVVKPATLVRMKQAKAALLDHFKGSRDVETISEADAEEWRAKLKELGYSSATISRTVLYARQVFRWGVRRGMARTNPFAELKAGAQVNHARAVYVSRETIAKVIDAAPDAEWRLLIALSRFGGLRVPSEALALRWSDVDWEHNRLTVRSPKTEHHEGKGERIIPLFPEIREHLMTVFEDAPVGVDTVITRYREGANLNPHFRRIIKRAGLTPWDRTWHNLRASRQTELAATFPLHTVCAWIGNTKAIAAGHYLQVTDADWARATGGEKAAANPATSAAANEATDTRPQNSTRAQKSEKPHEKQGLLAERDIACDAAESRPMGRAGLERAHDLPSVSQDSNSRGSNSGSIGPGSGDSEPPASQPPALAPITAPVAPQTPANPADPELAAIVAAWPTLPPAIRAGIVALVHAATARPTPSPTSLKPDPTA